MITTSSYDQVTGGRLVSISGDGGKLVSFVGDKFYLLAPKITFWQKWHDQIGVISEQENTDYYIKEYYNLVLRHLDYNYLLEHLSGATLLCYEDSSEFCHRHIVATWLELETGIVIPEIANINGSQQIVTRPEKVCSRVRKIITSTKENKND